MSDTRAGSGSPDVADALERELIGYMDGWQKPPIEFWARLWSFQAEGCAELGRFWRARGYDKPPSSYNELLALPAIPTDAFRFADLHSVREPITAVFRTSGTTSGERGQHLRSRLRPYEHGARLAWQRFYGRTARAKWLSLAPAPQRAPDSSLGFMIQDLAVELEGAAVEWALRDTGLDVDACVAWCEAARQVDEPVVVFGTTYAFQRLLESGADGLELPRGSVLLDTGGMKRFGEAMEPSEYRVALSEAFGLSLINIGAEYSMTELSSQLYTPWFVDKTLEADALEPARPARYSPPPWCVVSVVDPDSLAPLPDGEAGIIRFMDAANVDTCAWVQTSDLGRVISADGDIEHLGRAPGAVPRGCSLVLEELESLR